MVVADNDASKSGTKLKMQRRSIGGDLSGLCRLSTDAVDLTTQLVEAQHCRLDWFTNVLFKKPRRDNHSNNNKTRNPIAALVYNSIYAINSVVGTSVERSLKLMEPFLGETEPSKQKQVALAILNGVVGDYLHETNNPLAISMQFCKATFAVEREEGGGEVVIQDESRSHRNRYFLLLIHGSCNGPQDWWQKGHNHGIALAKELGHCYTPLFLQYNTGLHISENGKLLAQTIHDLATEFHPSARFSIVAHSMGGLVARSACHYVATNELEPSVASASWLARLDHLITLGSPHHGAILERGGKLVDAVLGAHHFTEPLSWLTQIRSKGVTDLGHGNVQQADWKDCDGIRDNRKPTPLPANVKTFAIAAVLGEQKNAPTNNRLWGNCMMIRTDGLVTEDSALGRGQSNKPEMNLEFNKSLTVYNASHVGLLSSPEVFQAMLEFLSQDRNNEPPVVL